MECYTGKDTNGKKPGTIQETVQSSQEQSRPRIRNQEKNEKVRHTQGSMPMVFIMDQDDLPKTLKK